MADILPFRALRYDPVLAPAAQVLTQPYDKITPEMQERYYRVHPCNLVRVVLGNPRLEAACGQDVYHNAAAYLRDWRKRGVLRPDPEPSIYVYSQRFTVPGSTQELERQGFIALGRIYDYAEGIVFRHEQTLSKPKQDRLNLLRATRAHCGQLFMLYSDPARQVDSLLTPGGTPELDVRDEYGVQHQLWRLSDPGTLARATAAMTQKKLIIADGHHRYETALTYRDERRTEKQSQATPGNIAPPNRGTAATDGDPWEYVMMTFINMNAPGLVILPTHRVISGLAGFDKDLFLRSAFPYFNINQTAVTDPARLLALLHDAGQQGTAFVAVIGREAFLLGARPGAANGLLAPLSTRQRQLDVVHLHKVLLQHVLGMSEESIRQQQNIRYLRDAGEAVHQARSGADVAFLMNPVQVEQVCELAFAGEVLPQKSTDFYPKLLSGLTIYALDLP